MDLLPYLALLLRNVADFWLWLLIGAGLIVSGFWLIQRRRPNSRKFAQLTAVFITMTILILGTLIVYAGGIQFWYTHRPLPPEIEQVLFDGVTYTRDVRQNPRPLVIHVVKIDLDMRGIRFLVTPGQPDQDYSLNARTTSGFLTEFDLQLAVNAGFFSPWWSEGIFNYYPHSGDPVNARGLASSEGVVYSQQDPDYPTLYLSANNDAQFYRDSGEIYNAVTGNVVFLSNGEVIPDDHNYNTDLHPRTAVALNSDGEILFLIVVDGRQPNYSEGVSLSELAQITLEFGGDTALNLDGGGSSTLVIEGESGMPIVLNSPIDHGLPGHERPVANHIGVYVSKSGY
jgi:hypothetical protein